MLKLPDIENLPQTAAVMEIPEQDEEQR